MPRKTTPAITRLWAKVAVLGADECWEWQGARQVKGYGNIGVGDKVYLVHRVVYEAECGPIPEGMVVRHTCDNPPCCNPAHLVVGTHQDNMTDRTIRGRGKHPVKFGEEHWNAKLTADQAITIRAAYAAGGVTQRELGERYGVTRSMVGHIVTGKSWAAVDLSVDSNLPHANG